MAIKYKKRFSSKNSSGQKNEPFESSPFYLEKKYVSENIYFLSENIYILYFVYFVHTHTKFSYKHFNLFENDYNRRIYIKFIL